VLVFSQYVETRYATQLLAESSGGVGYLLKDRVADVGDFVEALTRVAAGGTALDPDVVTQLLGASRRAAALDTLLTRRENEVLALMAEGRSNAAIANALVVGEGPCGEARGQHLRQAGLAHLGQRQPPGARRPALPGAVRSVGMTAGEVSTPVGRRRPPWARPSPTRPGRSRASRCRRSRPTPDNIPRYVR
jgi:hypothetical protein